MLTSQHTKITTRRLIWSATINHECIFTVSPKYRTETTMVANMCSGVTKSLGVSIMDTLTIKHTDDIPVGESPRIPEDANPEDVPTTTNHDGEVDDYIVRMLTNAVGEQRAHQLRELVRQAPPELAEFLTHLIVTGPTAVLVDQAASEHNFEAVRWLLDHEERATAVAMEWAAYFGDLEMAKLLGAHGVPNSPKAVLNAAYHDHIEILEWLKGYQEVEVSSEVFDTSAAFRSINALKWLRENTDIGPTPNAMDRAACPNSIEVLEWLREHYPNVGYTEKALLYVVRYGSDGPLPWLIEHRELFRRQDFTRAIAAAAEQPSAPVNILKQLRDGTVNDFDSRAKQWMMKFHDLETVRLLCEYHREHLYIKAVEAALCQANLYATDTGRLATSAASAKELLTAELSAAQARLEQSEARVVDRITSSECTYEGGDE